MPIIGSSASPKGVPTAPTIGTATAGDGSASVTFSAPSFSKLPITSYTVTASPGGATGTGASSPITVTGLTNGTAYTFTVRATHANGQSAASSASNSITPINPFTQFNASGSWTPTSYPANYTAYVIGGGAGYGGAYSRYIFQNDVLTYGGGGGGGYYATANGTLNAGSLTITVGAIGNNGANTSNSPAGTANAGGTSTAGAASAAGGSGGLGGTSSGGGRGGAGGSGGGSSGGYSINDDNGVVGQISGGSGGSGGANGGSSTMVQNGGGLTTTWLGGAGSGVTESSSGGAGVGSPSSGSNPSYSGFTVDGTTFASGRGLGASQTGPRAATGGFVLIKRNS